jgi:hypothetical protein
MFKQLNGKFGPLKETSVLSMRGSASASVGGCSCSASSFSLATFTGTLVIVGAEGTVDVNLSALTSQLRQVETDQFGLRAQSEILFDLFVNGGPVFSRLIRGK